MINELKVALKLKAKGYRHVIQITTKWPRFSNFGPPLFLKSADEAGPLLRSFNQKHDHAKIAWAKSVDEYIGELDALQ